MITFNHVSFKYASGFDLKDISLSLEKGELLSVVGPNGAGKSTLIKLAAGHLKAGEGQILVEEQPIDKMDSRSIAKKIAYLSQSGLLSDLTVEDVVLHGRFPHTAFPHHYGKSDRRLANDCIARMGLCSLAKRPLSCLSGGERQKALIAMALCQNSQALLLDEPTAFLDPGHRFSLMETLSDLTKQEKSVLCILHDLPLALRFSNRIAVMHKGRLLSLDTPENTLKSGVLSQVFGISIGKSNDGFYYYAQKNDTE